MRVAVLCVLAACGGPGHPGDKVSDGGGATPDVAAPDASYPATLDGNRDRLLHTYLAWLQMDPTTTMSNGLRGADLHDVCELWTKLDPSSQAVFLTITHRLEGATITADQSHMLDHVVTLYRLIGGQDATSTSAGSCGGGEYNRMIMSMDLALHDAQVAANTHQGAGPDIGDIPAAGFWRDSHDLGGPHAPFDLSDETNDGAPRGQTQYFKDPTSSLAHAPLGRMDLMTLVDPLALEMDQDYDCTHNSNPSCAYTFYGPACAPETNQPGTAIYTAGYGDFEPAWKPSGC